MQGSPLPPRAQRSSSWSGLCYRAAAARARSGGASKAMRRGRDSIAGKRGDVVDIPDGSIRAAERDFQHLIEIAVIEAPVPSDADQGASHQRVHRRWVEVIHEQAHILGVIAGGSELMRKSRDWHVGDGQQAIERDAEVVEQFGSVRCFEFRLRRR